MNQSKINVKAAQGSTIQLSSASWWVLAAFIFVVFPLVLLITFDRQIYRWYLSTFVLPELEQQLGFSAGDEVVLFPGERPHKVFGITAVRAQGVFARSGLRAGDVPVGYVHGFMEGFVSDIRHSMETTQPVEILVMNVRNVGTRRTIVFYPPRPSSEE